MSTYRLLRPMLTLILLLSMTMAGCIQPTNAPAMQPLKPGDKIGTMAVTKGPVAFDMTLPPYVAFCNAQPALKQGETTAKPGVYIIKCNAPPLPKMHIGLGRATNDDKARDEDWAAVRSELYVNGQMVDQAAFGSVDADVPVQAVPGEASSKVITVKLRVWNVVLENLTSGALTLRYVLHIDHELPYGGAKVPAGVYDFTYKINVDAAAAANPGTPEPVELVR